MPLVPTNVNCLEHTAIESVSEVARSACASTWKYRRCLLSPLCLLHFFLPSSTSDSVSLSTAHSRSFPPPPSLPLSFLSYFESERPYFRKSPRKEGATWSERETWSCHLLCVVGGETLLLVLGLGPSVLYLHSYLALEIYDIDLLYRASFILSFRQ